MANTLNVPVLDLEALSMTEGDLKAVQNAFDIFKAVYDGVQTEDIAALPKLVDFVQYMIEDSDSLVDGLFNLQYIINLLIKAVKFEEVNVA